MKSQIFCCYQLWQQHSSPDEELGCSIANSYGSNIVVRIKSQIFCCYQVWQQHSSPDEELGCYTANSCGSIMASRMKSYYFLLLRAMVESQQPGFLLLTTVVAEPEHSTLLRQNPISTNSIYLPSRYFISLRSNLIIHLLFALISGLFHELCMQSLFIIPLSQKRVQPMKSSRFYFLA